MLRVDSICKDYGNGKGIRDISFQVPRGKICAVLGSNGCGKTTTFRTILQLLDKDSGTLTFDEEMIEKKDYRLFGYVPEERSMLRNLTLEEHIYYLGRLKKMFDDEIEEKFMSLLSFFRMEGLRNKKISELSKGNQQKVQMMCALLHDPQILIFDEPLNGLDVNNVLLFKELLMKLKREKKVILISSHQYNNIEHYCDQVVYLKDGNILFKGDVWRLKNEYKNRYLKIRSKKSYKRNKGVLQSYKEKEYVMLEMKDKESALSLMKQCIEEEVDECHMELISLQKIIEDKTR